MEIRTETWHSISIGREKSITVTLPPSYSTGGGPFPVLSLLHGYGGNRQTWLHHVDLRTHLGGSRLITVLPECGRFWFIDDAGGRRYESYLIDEVVPYVDERFNTIAGREGRAIGGFSMGGASAVFQALRHADLFSAACSNSGAFEAPLRVGDPYRRFRARGDVCMPTVAEHERVWGPVGGEVRRIYDPYRLLEARDRSFPISVYADVGTDDFARVVSMNRNMRDAMLASGVDHDYFERAGGHDWEFVNAAAPAFFGFVRRALEGS